jgi:hypothetical protein
MTAAAHPIRTLEQRVRDTSTSCEAPEPVDGAAAGLDA